MKHKSILRLCLLLFATVVMASCEERPVTADTSISVGNILLADNTIISPADFDKQSQTAAGVIFYAKGDTVLVVGTKELGKYLYTDSIGTVSSVTNDKVSLCGTENTAAIMASDFSSPAVEAVNRYTSSVSGWALPSAGELIKLSQNLSVVRKTMAVIGGDDFTSEQYLSSSQDGSSAESTEMYYYGVSLEKGFVISVNKTIPGNVRPVLRLR